MSVATLVLVGCNGLLDVELPNRVSPEAFNDPARAKLLVSGVIAQFECAYANYVAASAFFTDEWINSAITGMIRTWDRRTLTENGVWTTSDCTGGIDALRVYPLGLYSPLAIARFQADDSYDRIAAWTVEQVPQRDSLLAVAAAYAGYTYTLFGEGFCRAVFDDSPILEPPQILERALDRFDRAIAITRAGSDPATLNMARTGRARVLLDLGHEAEALIEAWRIPENFVKYATYSATSERRLNFVYIMNHRERTASVDPRFHNLMVEGARDVRVRVRDSGRNGNDNLTRLFLQEKYDSESSPIPIASWDEAQLIIAEVEGGQVAVERINALRAQADLPALSSTNAVADIVQDERRRELYLEGHRLGDMRRLSIAFDRGTTHQGQAFGTQTCFPLPAIELVSSQSRPGRL